SPGTTYHYRIVATNASGTSRGSDGVFTTSSAPGVSTGSATDVSVTSARLNGSVDPNGRATTWFFEYGTSTSYGSRTSQHRAASANPPTHVPSSVSGLTRGRTYHFRLVATSDAGTTHGSDQTFSTTGAPTVATGSASGVTPTTAKLAGSVNPNGQSTQWYFEY